MAKKPTIINIESGFASTITLNSNFEQTKNAFDNTLSLDGSTPNAMLGALDLNNNDVMNADTVHTDKLILGGVLMTPSGVDPVFSGTVSAFGADFISDADAAAGRTTLGLSTVATTGSYTDLSNPPSLNFASVAQGALADSSIQPTNTQATSTWETGTSTTESLASPAKVKAAIESIASAPIPKAVAEAYVTYSGTTPTQVDGYGFSSVSRPSVGQTSFVFSIEQADTNYVVDSHMQNIAGFDGRYQWWLTQRLTTGFTVQYKFTTLYSTADLDLWVMARRLT
tara:strand:- start:68 stop:916 length:849 start_codon:yes stop_codon:yes gene_type:complete